MINYSASRWDQLCDLSEFTLFKYIGYITSRVMKRPGSFCSWSKIMHLFITAFLNKLQNRVKSTLVYWLMLAKHAFTVRGKEWTVYLFRTIEEFEAVFYTKHNYFSFVCNILCIGLNGTQLWLFVRVFHKNSPKSMRDNLVVMFFPAQKTPSR